jgi:predicted SprT family Zn-dependent metalloprotease
MALYIHDDGDKYDKPPYKYPGEAWNFYTGDLPIYIIGKYPYKAYTKKNAVLLSKIRKIISNLCSNLENDRNNWDNKEYSAGVDIFLGIHKEIKYNPKSLPEPFYKLALSGKKTSRYLINEIPKGTKFDGIDMPRMRYIEKYSPFVGKDGQERALYRDIYLNLDLSPTVLEKLIIHELAHTMANHVRYRPDDHHADFKWCEKLIKKYWH